VSIPRRNDVVVRTGFGDQVREDAGGGRERKAYRDISCGGDGEAIIKKRAERLAEVGQGLGLKRIASAERSRVGGNHPRLGGPNILPDGCASVRTLELTRGEIKK